VTRSRPRQPTTARCGDPTGGSINREAALSLKDRMSSVAEVPMNAFEYVAKFLPGSLMVKFRLCAFVFGIALAAMNVLVAAQRQRPTSGVHACALLTQTEFEKALGGKDPFDDRPPHEEALPGGRAFDCSFSSATLQVDPVSWATLEGDAKSHANDWKPVSGVGDAAYVNMNAGPDSVAVYAHSGQHALTVLVHGARQPAETPEKRRAAAIALAQALIAKLH
jgi:hypothetical protein